MNSKENLLKILTEEFDLVEFDKKLGIYKPFNYNYKKK